MPRHGQMELEVLADPEAVAVRAAALVADALREKPDMVRGPHALHVRWQAPTRRAPDAPPPALVPAVCAHPGCLTPPSLLLPCRLLAHRRSECECYCSVARTRAPATAAPTLIDSLLCHLPGAVRGDRLDTHSDLRATGRAVVSTALPPRGTQCSHVQDDAQAKW